jgi:hypothetical protein
VGARSTVPIIIGARGGTPTLGPPRKRERERTSTVEVPEPHLAIDVVVTSPACGGGRRAERGGWGLLSASPMARMCSAYATSDSCGTAATTHWLRPPALAA